jgi:hypothetical protein
MAVGNTFAGAELRLVARSEQVAAVAAAVGRATRLTLDSETAAAPV